MFTTTEIKKAWNIRKEAAIKWNCKVSEIRWSECLRLARMDKEATLKAHHSVRSYSEFKTDTGIDRLYLNVYHDGRNGDKATKIYWDRKTQQLVIQRGRGHRSGTFQESIDALENDFGFDVEK